MSLRPIISTAGRNIPLKALTPKGQEIMVAYVGQEPYGQRDSRIRTLVKPIVGLDGPNPFTMEVDGKAVEVFSSKNMFGMLTSKGKYRGFHGTSLGALMRYGIDQIVNRTLNPIGQRVYFDTVGTAIEYALEENFYDEKTSWFGGTRWVRQGMQVKLEDGSEATVLELPVVLALSCDETPEENDLEKDPGLFKYHYFSGETPVHIDAMWALNHNLSNERFNEYGEIKDDIGVGTTQRTAAMAFRQVSGVAKYY